MVMAPLAIGVEPPCKKCSLQTLSGGSRLSKRRLAEGSIDEEAARIRAVGQEAKYKNFTAESA